MRSILSLVKNNILLLPFKHELQIIAKKESLILAFTVIWMHECEVLINFKRFKDLNDLKTVESFLYGTNIT